jgi:glycosyltransferase involved in cell wall biosynthesis
MVRDRGQLMKILIVSQTYFPFLREGGRPTKVRAIAEGLSARGHDVTVLTSQLGRFTTPNSPDVVATTECSYGHCISFGGVKIIYLRTLLRRRTATLNLDVVRFCRRRIGDFDLVHVFGIYDFIGPIAAAHSRRLGVPYLLETMGMLPPVGRSRFAKRLYHRWIGRRLVAGAARVIASSQRESEEISLLGVPTEQITVRRNGVSISWAGTERGSFRRKHSIPEAARVALFLSRLVPEKSPDLLLRAFARVLSSDSARNGPWVLAIAGPCDDAKYRSRLKRLASSLGIDGAVRFIDGVYGEEKAGAIRDATFVVHPSRGESFGNSIAEAIACHTPVIATDQCGIAPLIADYPPSGLIVPHDEEMLAAAMLRLGRDTGLREEFVAACARVGSSLAWDQPLSQLEQLYEDCVRTPARAVVDLDPLSTASLEVGAQG